jgi:hypothetical protein
MFENPYGVPHTEILRMIVQNPPEVTAQVVFGKYVESSGLVFSGELIQQMFDRTQPVIRSQTYLDTEISDDNFRRWHRRDSHGGLIRLDDHNIRFYTGIDTARQTDFTVITTLDCTHRPARVVYWRRLNRVPWDSIFAEVGRVRDLFGPNILVDSTGPAGDVIMDQLETRLYCPEHHRVILQDSPRCMRQGIALDCDSERYLPLSCIEGYNFSGTTKKELVDHLRACLSVGYDGSDPTNDFGWIRSPSIPQLEDELAFYAWDDKKLQTDCVFSLALAAWIGLEESLGDPSFGSVYGN